MSEIPEITALDHLVLTVASLERTMAFYRDVLGMEVEEFQPADGSRRFALKFGVQKINLHLAGQEFRPHAKRPGPGTADLCFLSVTDLKAWQDHLDAQSITIEEGPLRRTGASRPLMSIYIRDPDGNLIEISNQI
ncbi:VOC family protein [Rhodobacteraceae bacterium MYP1-1]|uniref:VOC family protein n=2 Tax=Halocynthiibacter styelae TaxID=2761955 RepID=A0A8J7IW65_9RHOB|nr:VOC family protein [Paenihalocynthiibacter styelae]